MAGEKAKLTTAASEIALLDQIRTQVVDQNGTLAMGDWHGDETKWDANQAGTCGTTHCLAGWAQALSTDPEIRRLDPEIAGRRLIPRTAHLFFSTNDRAMKFLRDREYASFVD